MARERLNLRFSGNVGVDMHYSTKSAYTEPGKERVVAQSPRTKILVATHCFFDNPHPYGVNLFPDFYEWLYFLGEISEKTDYDWYIKTHPDFLPGNIPIIEEFIGKHPRFTLIPPHTSHLQLIEEGIDFGLTVVGTIGFEYAALGIPVVNASLCNPHVRYKFNIHPKTIDEYEKLLMDLPNQKLEIDINEVYEYYFMAFIHKNTNNWLFRDYESLLEEAGGYMNHFGSISYEIFVREFLSWNGMNTTVRSLREFVDSKAYRYPARFKWIMIRHISKPSQAVILAGGRGSRLRPLTDTMPKPMLPFHGKPFLEYLVEHLKEQGFEKVLLLLGYLPEVIMDHFGDGGSFGLRVEYSVTDVEDDTGRRLQLAAAKVDPCFLLMYGDNYWPMRIDSMWNQFI